MRTASAFSFSRANHSHLVWIVILASIVWKRRMTRGGSWMALRLKQQALEKKRRTRKRLRDFLSDDLLRRQMEQEFTEKMGREEALCHMEELELKAHCDVTPDDIHVCVHQTTDAVILWICCVYLAVILLLLLTGRKESQDVLAFTVTLIFHIIDNRLNFATFWMDGAWITTWLILVFVVSSLYILFDRNTFLMSFAFILLYATRVYDRRGGSSARTSPKTSRSYPSLMQV